MRRLVWQEKYVYGQIVFVGKALELITQITDGRVKNSTLVDAVTVAKSVYIAEPIIENLRKIQVAEKALVAHVRFLMRLEMQKMILTTRIGQRGINVVKWTTWEQRWDRDNVGRVASVAGKMLEVIGLIAEKESTGADAAAVDAKLPVLVLSINSILEAA